MPTSEKSKTHRQQRNREKKNSPRSGPVPSASGREATKAGRPAGSGVLNSETLFCLHRISVTPQRCRSLGFPSRPLSSPPRPSDVGWTQPPGDVVSWSYSHRYKNPNSNSLRGSSPSCSGNNGNVLKARRVRTAKGRQ